MALRITPVAQRRLFHSSALISALIAVGVAALWARSYSYIDSLKHYVPSEQRFDYVVLVRGGLQLARCHGCFDEDYVKTYIGVSFHTSSDVSGIGDEW